MSASHLLVFDIETAALPWDEFDGSQQEYLLRGAESEEEQEKRKDLMALSPLTAKIVCIGLMCMRREGNELSVEKEGALCLDESMADDETRQETLPSGIPMSLSSEATLLRHFWKMLRHYNRCELVSFNGRGFDAPFLMLRSAVHRIRPTRNLMEGSKWNYKQHVDLADELSFYGYQSSGPQRRFNFDFYARSFGITSPKAQGIDGSKVAEFFAEGKIADVAEYCMRDVKATWELFLFWNEYLNTR